eukprot:TRINITY_DN10888_c0_g2_i2.p1 TRINITY_DN10888_c0_g2~~TRINITY_DN10888_c0_g2_i2.p1  ORF type:complete len:124 (+),score=27.41 TRINITY_DN10888_c0_g2_i2:41-412(+)
MKRCSLAWNPKQNLINDVTAAVEAKAEVEEIVHYVRDPKRFTHLGGNEEVQLRCFASGAFPEKISNLVDKVCPTGGGGLGYMSISGAATHIGCMAYIILRWAMYFVIKGPGLVLCLNDRSLFD